jgi:hypothetical protein
MLERLTGLRHLGRSERCGVVVHTHGLPAGDGPASPVREPPAPRPPRKRREPPAADPPEREPPHDPPPLREPPPAAPPMRSSHDSV